MYAAVFHVWRDSIGSKFGKFCRSTSRSRTGRPLKIMASWPASRTGTLPVRSVYENISRLDLFCTVYTSPNRTVFSCRLKMLQSVRSWISLGRVVHAVGDHCPLYYFVHFAFKVRISEIARRWRWCNFNLGLTNTNPPGSHQHHIDLLSLSWCFIKT